MIRATTNQPHGATQTRESIALAVREIGDTLELIQFRIPQIVAIARAMKLVTGQPATLRELAGLIEDLADVLGDDVRSDLEATRQGLQELADKQEGGGHDLRP